MTSTAMHIARARSAISSMGPRDAAGAALRRAYRSFARYFDWEKDALPVRPSDLVFAAPTSCRNSSAAANGPLRIGWICSPPGPGSGGHTTLFRMVEAAEARGHDCTLFLYDRNSDDVTRHEQGLRSWWPRIKANIRSATDGMQGMDALVASSWGTAHVLASRRPPDTHCFYFVQDFEPYFYPRGALYSFAEDTYKFGFSTIALGQMVAASLDKEVGIRADYTVPFGCDLNTYSLLERGDDVPPRRGIVYYAKRSVDRRGHLLAKLALGKFYERHPEHDIHVYGDIVTNLGFPVINHGTLSPQELNRLYNATIASLALSFTNITLVVEEMMAAGNVPVVNEHPFARAVLTTPGAAWSAPTADSIADALSAAVSAGDVEGNARRIASYPRNRWEATGDCVATAIEDACRKPQSVTPGRPGGKASD